MRAAAFAVVSVLALSAAACNPAKKDEAAPGAPAGPAAPGAPSAPNAPTGPSGLPHRQTGLWESTMAIQDQGAPPMTTRICLDAATEAKSAIWGADVTKDMCQKNEITRQLDGSYKFSSVCNMGSGGVTRSQGVATGDLTSNYTVTMSSTTSGAELEMMNRDMTYTVSSRRIGPCEPGQRGGDMIMNGRVVGNMNDMTASPTTGKR